MGDSTIQFGQYLLERFWTLENPNPDLYGDLNGDGLLNVLDVVVMVNLVLTNDCPDGSDMNSDGSCNVLDVVILVNLILG